MPSTFTTRFETAIYTGSSTFNTGLFINNEWVDPVKPDTIDVINPATENVITHVSLGSSTDVDIAVKAARTAFKTTWGLNCPGSARGEILNKFAHLLEKHLDEISALEALNNGKPPGPDLRSAVQSFKYFAGWAGKMHGKTVETNPAKFAYTRQEPIGVCGQIIPWNFPFGFACWKLAPALACGCTIVMKPSEITPLTLLRICELIKEAGFPPGVINVVTGYGNTVGQAIAEHHDINKVSFTGSTAIGRRIVHASADSNLKVLTLELGGKSPNIILDDADLEQAVKWTHNGIFTHAGQICTAGSRIFIQEGIYDKFLQRFTEVTKTWKVGDPFQPGTRQGPQISKVQFDRVMGYIESGKKAGATLHLGGERHGTEGFFIQPTIFTDVTPDMQIVREEIFGPVAVIIKFKTDDEVIALANDTQYGLAGAVFSQNINRALKIGHGLEAGSVFINCYNWTTEEVPFGGYKTSGWGRDFGEEVLKCYTQTKAVHINLGSKL